MLIFSKSGHISTVETGDRGRDILALEWYETRKRIQRKVSAAGRALVLKFLDASPDFTEGDIVYMDEQLVIIVEIIPCECLVIRPESLFETASVCYEIGNKHLPLFYEEGELLVPYEEPLHRLLQAQGFQTERTSRKLLQPLKTSVAAHNGSASLFERIMHLTSGDK